MTLRRIAVAAPISIGLALIVLGVLLPGGERLIRENLPLETHVTVLAPGADGVWRVVGGVPLSPLVQPLLDALARLGPDATAADALALLPEILPDLDPDALADLLTRATATARVGAAAGGGAGEDQE
jgi:hypothetical protein